MGDELWNDVSEAYLLECLDQYPPFGLHEKMNLFCISRYIHRCAHPACPGGV